MADIFGQSLMFRRPPSSSTLALQPGLINPTNIHRVGLSHDSLMFGSVRPYYWVESEDQFRWTPALYDINPTNIHRVGFSNDDLMYGSVRPYYWVESEDQFRWTPALHHRFLHAIAFLRLRKMATPKMILLLMDTKDLTLVHVKSHLMMFIEMKLDTEEETSTGYLQPEYRLEQNKRQKLSASEIAWETHKRGRVFEVLMPISGEYSPYYLIFMDIIERWSAQIRASQVDCELTLSCLPGASRPLKRKGRLTEAGKWLSLGRS